MTTDMVYESEQTLQDKQDELRAAKEAIAGPVPLIEDAPDPVLVLPRGLFRSGVWEREALVRELTGVDEEALAKAKTPLAYFNTVLALGTVSIGTFDLSGHTLAERQFFLNELLLGEREQLFLKVVQVSFGNERVVNFTCQSCNVGQEVTLLIDTDFPPAKVENVDQSIFTHTTSKDDVVTYRAATGADTEEILTKRGLTLAEQNTVMLSRCITKLNDGLIVDSMAYARSLSMRDRQKLLELLVERQPTIELNITTTCASCGASQTLGMGWGDFFRS